MQGALDLRLPWQRMNELVQPDRRFQVREGLALVVEQLQVGDQAERVGHGDHPRHQSDPVPSHPGFALCRGRSRRRRSTLACRDG